jgi:hypothetical protein
MFNGLPLNAAGTFRDRRGFVFVFGFVQDFVFGFGFVFDFGFGFVFKTSSPAGARGVAGPVTRESGTRREKNGNAGRGRGRPRPKEKKRREKKI